MKIVLVNFMETTAPGGINKAVLEIAKNLSENHETVVLQLNPFNLPNEELFEGFKIIRVNSGISNYLHELSPEMYFYLKKNLKKLNPDIVHIHGYNTLLPSEIIYTLSKIDSKIPVVLSPHFANQSHSSFAGKYLWNVYNSSIGKKIIKYPKTIITASNHESKDIQTFLDVPAEKIKIIHHGVDSIDLENRYPTNEEIKLLYVGYLLEIKGVQHIIEVLHELIKANINARLTIIGEGPYENNLKKLAEKLGIGKFISWNEFVHPTESLKLLNYYKKADIFMLLSKTENYGIVVPEALAMGTPVIVTKNTALKEFLNEPGCFGFDYPPDPGKIAEQVVKIHESKISAGPLSGKIRTWDNIANDYETVYENLVKNTNSF